MTYQAITWVKHEETEENIVIESRDSCIFYQFFLHN